MTTRERLRSRHAVLAAACALIVAACADDGGDAERLTEPPATDSTTTGRIHGTVVIPSVDSLSTWRPSAGVRVEVAVRDAGGRLEIVAATITDALGRFALPALAAPPERLVLRATPIEPGYRPTRWLAASGLRDSWGTYTIGRTNGDAALVYTLGPYVVLERAEAPDRAYAPILLMGHVLAPGLRSAVADARVVFGHAAGVGAPVASARADAAGFFLVQLPDAGPYAFRVSPPVGSPYADQPPRAPSFVATSFPDATASNYLLAEVRAVGAPAR